MRCDIRLAETRGYYSGALSRERTLPAMMSDRSGGYYPGGVGAYLVDVSIAWARFMGEDAVWADLATETGGIPAPSFLLFCDTVEATVGGDTAGLLGDIGHSLYGDGDAPSREVWGTWDTYPGEGEEVGRHYPDCPYADSEDEYPWQPGCPGCDEALMARFDA